MRQSPGLGQIWASAWWQSAWRALHLLSSVRRSSLCISSCHLFLLTTACGQLGRTSSLHHFAALVWKTLKQYNRNSFLLTAGEKGTTHILRRFQRSTWAGHLWNLTNDIRCFQPFLDQRAASDSLMMSTTLLVGSFSNLWRSSPSRNSGTLPGIQFPKSFRGGFIILVTCIRDHTGPLN